MAVGGRSNPGESSPRLDEADDQPGRKGVRGKYRRKTNARLRRPRVKRCEAGGESVLAKAPQVQALHQHDAGGDGSCDLARC